MDSFEWNRLAGWILAAAILVLGLSIVSGMVYTNATPATKGYKVEGVVEASAEGPAAAVPITAMMAMAQPARGEVQFKKCLQCHNVNAGGANGIGPNLHGIVGAPVAAKPGFGYSNALKEHGGRWEWERLSAWLENPRKAVPGNKMSFAGISKAEDRADVLAYLNSQSANPLPLPKGPPPGVPVDSSGEAAPAEAAMATDKAAPAPGKAPDTTEGQVTPAALAQPQGNISGPGAPEASGTSERETTEE